MGPRYWKNLPADVAAVTLAAGDILSTRTLLGVTGTLAAAAVTLDHLGGIGGDSTVLSGCNIGTVTLVDCYGVAVDSALDLSDNRLIAGAAAAGPGLRWLVAQIYAAIVGGASGATGTLTLTGNAVPNATTIGYLIELATAGWTSHVDAPIALTVTGDLDPPQAVGDYTRTADINGVPAFVNGNYYIAYSLGYSNYVITTDPGGEPGVGGDFFYNDTEPYLPAGSYSAYGNWAGTATVTVKE